MNNTPIILPHTFPPFITGYPDFTDILFAFQREPTIFRWLLINMISLYAMWQENEKRLILNFANRGKMHLNNPALECPYIDVQTINQNSMLLDKLHIEDLLKNNIDNGQYTSVYLDHYYIKDSARYQYQHYFHPYMLYGYDSQQAYAVGFCGDSKYKQIVIGFDSLSAAYNSVRQTNNIDYNLNVYKNLTTDNTRTSASKFDSSFSKYYECGLSDTNIKFELINYLNERRYISNGDTFMGIDVYTGVERYCMFLIDNPEVPIFIQAIQILHVHVMVLRALAIELFHKTEFENCEFQNVVNDLFETVNSLKMILVKASVKNDYSVIARNIEKIQKAKMLETQLVYLLLDM